MSPPLLLLSALLLLLLGRQAELAVEQECRECLCAGGSTCQMPAKGDCQNEIYCGPYSMSPGYWADAGRSGDDFHTCMADWACANQTLDNYMDRYCTELTVGHAPPCGCEEQIKIHHCGPYAWHTDGCETLFTSSFASCLAS